MTAIEHVLTASKRWSQRVENRINPGSDAPFWRHFDETVEDELAKLPDGAVVADLGGGRKCWYADAVPTDRGVRLVSVETTWICSPYFFAVFPLYLAVALYQGIARRLDARNLASYMMVVAER